MGAENLAFTEVRSPVLPIFTLFCYYQKANEAKPWHPPIDAMLFRTSEEQTIEKYFHADF